MPPIKLYADAPLHPEGVTPKTAAAEDHPEKESAPQPTRTTNLPSTDPSVPPPPQPGARPQPGPAPTAALSSSGPPPPRPGAVPQPVITATHTTTTTGQLPPPSQLNIPPPTSNQAPTHSTYVPQASPYETGASAAPAAAGGLLNRRASLEHPPGYQQNPYASVGTPDDRARYEDAARTAGEEEGVIGSVKSALSGVGKTLEKLEGEAWKIAKGKN